MLWKWLMSVGWDTKEETIMRARNVNNRGSRQSNSYASNVAFDISKEARKDFFARIRKYKGCWLWTGSVSTPLKRSNELPVLVIDGVMKYARILSLMLANKEYESWSRTRLTCSSPLCVNPEHITWGLRADCDYYTCEYCGREALWSLRLDDGCEYCSIERAINYDPIHLIAVDNNDPTLSFKGR